MRNPWGKGEWNGDWGDKSDKWTPKLKKQFNITDKDDGAFFMTYEDFIENFTGVSACHYRDDYFYSSMLDCNAYNAPSIYEFQIHETGEYYFGVSQPDKNLYGEDFSYSYMGIVIIRIENGLGVYVGGEASMKRDNWFMQECDPGVYIAVVNTNWRYDQHKYSINIYGPKNISIKPVLEKESKELAMKFHRQGYIEYVN